MNTRSLQTNGGFLFATFNSEATTLSEQVYFGLSRDGRDWHALSDGEPALISQLGEKGVRDPFLIRAHDGSKVFLLATDLSIHLNPDWKRAKRAGSRSIVIWASEDLMNWSAPRLVEVAVPDAGCSWAPEAVYDAQNGNYLVFWASTNARDDFSKQRIWARRTQDFYSFSEPFLWIDKPHTVIDTDIVWDGERYYRFSKDEEFKAITLESSETLSGLWKTVPDFSLARMQGVEGPQCFLLENGDENCPPMWCLLLDFYASKQGYKAFLSHDLARGHFEAAPDFSFPFQFRHGSVLPLTAEEWARLKSLRAHMDGR